MLDATEVARWEGEPVAHWARVWNLPRLHVFATTGSTNDVLRQLADDGAPEASTVIADEQSAGRGRLGRSWTAPPGRALLMSTILRPAPHSHGGTVSVVPLRIGIAVAQAIEDLVGLRLLLKWPNDVIVPGAGKVAGVLCEAVLGQGASGFIIAGIGINVNQAEAEWPPELAGHATSLAMTAGHQLSRARLAAGILARIRDFAPHAHHPLSPAELREYDSRDSLRGLRILVDGRSAGTAAGITPDGALVVETPSGNAVIRAGTVRLEDRAAGHQLDKSIPPPNDDARPHDANSAAARVLPRPHRTL